MTGAGHDHRRVFRLSLIPFHMARPTQPANAKWLVIVVMSGVEAPARDAAFFAAIGPGEMTSFHMIGQEALRAAGLG